MKVKENNSLELKNISKLYPGTIALRNINLSISGGYIHGIIGKNGAGKSTLINIISGLTYPSEGLISINGKEYPRLSRILSKKENIAVITQEPQLVPEHTIVEALFSPNYIQKNGIINWKKMKEKSVSMLNSPLLKKIKGKRAIRDLTISEQQLLLVFKAINLEGANIIILDETTASLTQDDQNLLYEFIINQKNMGKSIIFITHRMQEILDICDKVSVLRDGELINTISTKNLNMGELSSYIIGDSKLAEIDSTDRKKTKKKISDETVLQLKDLSKMGDFMNINLEIKRGEIVGLAGLRGSGRTELFNSIIGINNFDTGVLKVKNVEKKFKSPSEALAGGIAYLPEERDREGIVNELGVMDNLVLSCLKKLCVFKNVGIIKDSKKRDLAKNLIKKLSIKTISLDQKVKDLSGGNKQKVVVGKILSVMPDIFILDEPTKGIDIEAKNSILNIIEKDLSREAGILITSPGLGDLIKICDRIIVLLNGEIVEEVESNKFNENKIYLAMQGKINS